MTERAGGPGLDATALAELDATIEHFNANHADTVLFVARYGARRDDITDAEWLGVDDHGADLSIRVAGGGAETLRMPFPSIASSADDVRAHVLGTLDQARTAAGESVALTSLEREFATNPTLPTFAAEVAEVSDLSPNLREIVVEGDFHGLTSHGHDQFVYVMVPRDASRPIPADHTMAAQKASMVADPDAAPLGAYYTVRRWDADRGRVTLWAVVHDHPDSVGRWVSRAAVGDRCALWGPREGFGRVSNESHHVLVADESGFAAVAVLLDELPPGANGRRRARDGRRRPPHRPPRRAGDHGLLAPPGIRTARIRDPAPRRGAIDRPRRPRRRGAPRASRRVRRM